MSNNGFNNLDQLNLSLAESIIVYNNNNILVIRLNINLHALHNNTLDGVVNIYMEK